MRSRSRIAAWVVGLTVTAVVATLGIFTFVALYENYVIRVVLAGFCWAVSLGACAWSLFRHGESMLSRNVLMLIFGVAGSMMAARSVFYLVGAWGTPRLLDGAERMVAARTMSSAPGPTGFHTAPSQRAMRCAAPSSSCVRRRAR